MQGLEGQVLQVFLCLSVTTAYIHTACVERTEPNRTWSTQTYPNPQRNPASCGQNSPSYVCDPDGLLGETDASRLDTILKNYKRDGLCLCGGNCLEGVKMSVALMGRIESDSTFSVQEYLERFTSWLKDTSWKFAVCEDDLYVAVSDYERKIHVRTGSKTKQYLSNDCVNQVVENTLPHLCNKEYYSLLSAMTSQFKNMIEGSRNGDTRCSTGPGDKSDDSSTGTTVAIVLAAIAGVVIVVGLLARFICGGGGISGGGGGEQSGGFDGDGGGGGGGEMEEVVVDINYQKAR